MHTFYTNYARLEGFDVVKRNTNIGNGQKIRLFYAGVFTSKKWV